MRIQFICYIKNHQILCAILSNCQQSSFQLTGFLLPRSELPKTQTFKIYARRLWSYILRTCVFLVKKNTMSVREAYAEVLMYPNMARLKLKRP
jgi:hypothetical protein